MRGARAAWGTLLFLGPISLGLALALLVAGRGLFDHGPGVPTAGREEAWTLLWVCVGIVLLGQALGAGCALAGLLRRLWRHERPDRALRWSLLYAALVGLPILYGLLVT
jgi:hypothetical protein